MRPEHIIKNALERSSASDELDFESAAGAVKAQYNTISVESSRLPHLHVGNTVFAYEQISAHPKSFQAHFQRISDYLVLGRGVWFKLTDIVVEFMDSIHCVQCRREGPLLKSFTNTSMSSSHIELSACWKKNNVFPRGEKKEELLVVAVIFFIWLKHLSDMCFGKN